jgi:DNA-binding MarR family transcriptional regulator
MVENMTTRWLTKDEQTAWIRFAAVLELLPGVLDSQLLRDEGLTHFDYFALAMLSEAPQRTLRTTQLAGLTSATLPRLSRVLNRLEQQGLVERRQCPTDRRATNVVLTEQGWAKVVHAAPGHVRNVRSSVLDTLSPEQLDQLSTICAQLLSKLDPTGKMFSHALR